MKDTDWKIIVALYDCKNITKAANMLYMSQPTLSKNINRIEEELGGKIIERSNKGIVFTEGGEYLAMQALEISKLIADTMQRYRELKDGGRVISIGCASSFVRYSLPGLIQKFNEENCRGNKDKLRYNVQVMTSSEIIGRVQRQELKIGFINGDRNWDSKVLCSVGYGYIISKDPINMEELPQLPLICHYRDAYSLNVLSNWWKCNFETPFHVTYMVADITTSLQWIEEGLGYGIMYSNTAAPKEYEKFYKIPMTDQEGKPIRRNTWMIYHPNRANDPIIKKFIKFVSSLNINDMEQQI